MKKSKLSEVADTARSIAGAALGAAAATAAGVVVSGVAEAVQQGGRKLEDSRETLQYMAAKTVADPVLPNRKRRTASRRKTLVAKPSAKRASAKRATSKKAARPRGRRMS